LRGFLLFDIDGVLRDVTSSYRLAIQETVNHFSGWRPTLRNIDNLKAEGSWNNDWKASHELISRRQASEEISKCTPNLEEVIKVFNHFYFGGDPTGNSQEWKGFIKNEPLLVNQDFFQVLTQEGFKWGFVSGAESSSAKFILEERLSLKNPPLISMEDAPDKPNPTGLLKLSNQLAGKSLGKDMPPIAYLGDTVADIQTIKEARRENPEQIFISLAVAPPHLHDHKELKERRKYESILQKAGADLILQKTTDILKEIQSWESIVIK